MRPARRSAAFAARVAACLIRSRHPDWAAAMTAEVEAVEADGAALSFALGCVRAAFLDFLRCNGASLMNLIFGHISRPQAVGLLCAAAAVACGLVYLHAAGAPSRLVTVNAVAFVLALAVFPLASALLRRCRDREWAISTPTGAALLATAFLGSSADGASRWVVVGPLALQPSLILLPMLLVMYARRPTAATLAGVLLAAAGMALQPDRAMAGMMATALGILLASNGDRWTALAFAASTAAFALALVQPETLPASPFVDGILFSAYGVHPLIGVLLWLGGLSLAAPAISAAVQGAGDKAVWTVFGASWLAILAAAALGNYPTPLVGYGGSAILGYLLSLSVAGAVARQATAVDRASAQRGEEQPPKPFAERTLAAC